MDQTMLVLSGLVVGLLIALVVLIVIINRPPTMVYVPPPTPPPAQDSGCAGILVSGVMVFIGLVFWVFILI
ncbi:protein of unknown function [Candidatus Promineifilum breve]|uniref:Transmembrane protein n=2 Tax=Candidatus Promineifilum breve TaxID=1806508 RepID=A0A160T6S1_9CHLR|nr:protein of unknown function [Candidatus Promineifilum breve]